MQVTEVLNEIRPRLDAAFGRRLKGVILFGSRARGEVAPDSDMDLMVLLEGPIDLGKDLDAIVHALYPLQLEVDYAINAMPADIRDFEAQKFGIYRNAKREGIAL
jgi:predicted nucleotidyltransferase